VTDCEKLNQPLFSVDLADDAKSPHLRISPTRLFREAMARRCMRLPRNAVTCVLAQLRNYHREGEAESMKSDSAGVRHDNLDNLS
jgi:hypothetical protein